MLDPIVSISCCFANGFLATHLRNPRQQLLAASAGEIRTHLITDAIYIYTALVPVAAHQQA